jgi:multidrug resistance efflux pump
MLKKYALPLAALALLGFAVLHLIRAHATAPKAAPPVQPGRAGFGKSLAGVGLVEAQTQNIAVGAPLSALVTEVPVQVGQRVKAGSVLFRLDARTAVAEVKVREAALEAAEAELDRLIKMPREEDLPPARARVAETEANLKLEVRLLRIAHKMYRDGAVPREEMHRREQAHEAARQQLAKARADLKLLEAGAWAPDKAVSRTKARQARAALEQARTELDRLSVRAPVDGEVLQVNVRPGELASATPGQSLVMLGNVGRLHVRVEFDEHDIHRFRAGAPARASLRGNPQVTFPLTFVRVEPYVLPKKSLTNDSGERVDTRVMQVIFAVEGRAPTLYVGQQLDVSIEAARSGRPTAGITILRFVR